MDVAGFYKEIRKIIREEVEIALESHVKEQAKLMTEQIIRGLRNAKSTPKPVVANNGVVKKSLNGNGQTHSQTPMAKAKVQGNAEQERQKLRDNFRRIQEEMAGNPRGSNMMNEHYDDEYDYRQSHTNSYRHEELEETPLVPPVINDLLIQTAMEIRSGQTQGISNVPGAE